MIKSLWPFVLCILFISCASSPEDIQLENVQGGEAISLPKPSLEKGNFSPYFSTIDNAILLDIQTGSPTSIQRAIASLRSEYNNASEQALVLLAICATIMDYAWPSRSHVAIINDSLPTNVYTSTVESIRRGIYEGSFDDSDFFILTLPSLVLFSSNDDYYFSEAKLALERALRLDSNSVFALYLIGVLEMRMGNYEAAKNYLEKAIVLDRENMDLIYAYFNVLIEAGLLQDAYTFGQDLMQRYPSDVRVFELAATVAYERNDFTEAESLIAQSIRLAPENISLLLFRAKVLFELGDYLDVSSLLDVYSRTNPQNKDYLILRAKLQSTWNKNITSAIRTVQDAITLYPNDSEVLLLAASLASTNAQRILGQSALELLTGVLETEPENIQAYQILVTESIAQQNWQEAYEASTFVLSKEAPSINAVLQHVEICLALNLLDEARSTIDEYYSPETDNENLQQWYIRLLIAEGRYTDASNLIERFLQSSSGRMKSVLYFERSRLQNNDTRILSDLRSSLTSNPRNEYALFGLYTYYYERQDYSKAQYYLKQVIALNPSNTDAIEKNAELDILLQ